MGQLVIILNFFNETNIQEQGSFIQMLSSINFPLNQSGKNIIILFNNNQDKNILKSMYCYPLSMIQDRNNYITLCFMPNYYGIYLGDANNIFTPEIYNINSNYTENLSKSVETTFPIEINHSLFALNTEVETPNKKISSKITDKTSEIQLKNAYRKCQKLGIQEIKLQFRTQWKNQNRNIVPNLVNQMMSFLLKKNKSQKLVSKLFNKFSHEASWTQIKFYLYMKKIKDSISHYVNESVIQYFFQIHQPKCEIYQQKQQQFYMKVCRIAILNFLNSDAIIISLTSSRMSQAKRKTHLIARQAILNKFLQLARCQ